MAAKKQPKKSDALEKALAAVRAKLGRTDAAVRLSAGGARSAVGEVIPTGLSVIDNYLIGTGGLPVGRCSEWAGEEGVGKTTLAYYALAAVQRMGGLGIYGDAENSFDEQRAADFGVDPEQLMLVQCDSLEEYAAAMVAAVAALDGSTPALAVYDSIAGSTTNAEMEGDFSGDAMGRKAGLIGKMVRSLAQHAAKNRAHVMFINQLRKKVGVAYGDPSYTPGGDAPKYICSVRFRVTGGAQWKANSAEGAPVIGKMTGFRTTKNRHATPFRKAEVRLNFEKGFDEKWSVIAHAKDRDLVPEDSKLSDENYCKALAALGWGEAVVASEEEAAIPAETP